MAAASSVPLWRWRSAELITTAASARQTLWVRELLPHGHNGLYVVICALRVGRSLAVYRPLLLTLAADNGLNPVWVQRQFVFDIHNPTFSFLRFTVYEEDMFSDPNFLAQATYPVRLLRTGE